MIKLLKVKGILVFLTCIFFTSVNLYAQSSSVSSWANLNYAINTVHATSITFSTGNIVYSGSLSTISYAGPINFYGGVILNGNNANQLFNFSNTSVNFNSHISFINGSYGAIDVEKSNINFISTIVNFTNNTVQNYYGGAIYAAHSNIKFISTIVNFTSNTASSGGGAIYAGYFLNINFMSSRVNFTNNTAQSLYGGAISAIDDSNINFTSSTVDFTGNTSNSSGGAISAWNYSKINFASSTVSFTSNTASQYGGAIYVLDSNINFTSSTVNFTSNTAGSGGAIYAQNSNINFMSSTVNFTNNKVQRGFNDGGAIYADNSSNINFTSSTVNFTSNTAADSGGAIYNEGTVSLGATLGRTITFANNSAVYGRDIFGVAGSTLNINGLGNVVFGGGIEGRGTINKTNTGNVYFMAGSKTNFGGKFDVNGGIVYFSTSVYIKELNVGNAGIGINADFSSALGTNTSFIYTATTTLTSNSKLYVNKSGTGVAGSSTAVMFAQNGSGNFGMSNISGAAGYRFEWKADNLLGGYTYTGWLLYSPWNYFVEEYQKTGKVNGEILYLTENIKAAAGDDDPFGATLSNNFTIAGDGGNMTIDADNRKNKGFVLSGKTITFKDLTFQNFERDNGNGGVIQASNYSSITFGGNAVNFTSNTASNYGAAIYASGNSNINIGNLNMVFSGNSAGTGGAIYLGTGASISFSGSTITAIGNEAGIRGGFLYSNGQTINFNRDVNLVSNTATNNGGAIYINNGALTFSDSLITINYNKSTIDGNGGGIFLAGNPLADFKNIDLKAIGNEALSGGAIFAGNNSNINIENSNMFFSGNSANTGGAIYLGGSVSASFFGSTITATGNVAVSSGGFLYSNGQTFNFDRNVSLISNTATDAGGAIYANNGTLTFSGSSTTINYNKATGGNGGGIFLAGNALADFKNTDLKAIENEAKNGGAIFAGNNSSLNFTNSTAGFIGNVTSSSGGAIYLDSGVSASFAGSTITAIGNEAGIGGAIYLTGNSPVTFNDSNINFTNNTANNYGGAISAEYSPNINFVSSVINFTGNTANRYGGAIYAYNGSNISNIDFTSSGINFTSNTADDGGAIYARYSSNVNFTSSVVNFAGNTASNSGGGIYAYNGSDINFTSSAIKFTSNTAEDGGAIFAEYYSNINFASSIVNFAGNTSNNGGAIYLMRNGTIIFDNSDITATGNVAISSGGFLFSDGNKNIEIDLDKIHLAGNMGGTGGTFYGQNGTTFTFTAANSNISNSTAGYAGGFIALGSGGNADFSGTTLNASLNKAGRYGGFMYLTGNAQALFGKAKFENNRAEKEGGAIYLDGNSQANFENTSFEAIGNAAGENGGAIALNSSKMTFDDFVEFRNNEALEKGGAIYVSNGSTITFSNAGFVGNKAGEKGGAIYVEGKSTVEFKTSTQTIFSGNRAGESSNALYAGNGGAIYFETDAGASVEMYDGIGGESGGKIYVKGDGVFNLYSNAMENGADIKIESGKFNFKNGANLTAGVFENDENSVLDMQDGKQNELTVSKFISKGTTKIDLFDVNVQRDRIISTGDIELGAESKLEVQMSADMEDLDFRKKVFKLIGYGGNLSGEFEQIDVMAANVLLSTAAVNVSHGNFINDWITIEVKGNNESTKFSELKGMTFNQREVARAYDKLSKTADGNDLDAVISTIDTETDVLKKEFLGEAAGYFVANVIRSGGESGNDGIYERIEDNEENIISKGLWAEGKVNVITNKADKNSPNDYKDSIMGAVIGYDMKFEKIPEAVIGAYGKINKHEIRQDAGNEGEVTNTAIGVYGGYVKSKWEVKAMLSGSAESYKTERRIQFMERKAEADFNGLTINADIEGAYKMDLNRDMKLRYYAGMGMRRSSYGEIKEKGAKSLDIIVEEGSYERAAGRLGVGIEQKKEIYGWYARGEYKILFNGNVAEIENRFEGTGEKFKSRGSEEGKGELGLKAGGSVRIGKGINIYADAGYYTGDKYGNVYGDIGVRWFVKP